MLLELLTKTGVNIDFVKKIDGESGHAIIQKDTSGQNSILLHGGGNKGNFRLASVDKNNRPLSERLANLVHCSYSKIIELISHPPATHRILFSCLL